MDKLLRSPWFVRAISLFTAILLYAFVSSTEQPSNGSQANLLGDNQQSTSMTEKLDVKFDSNRYVITGAPDSVKLEIKGPSDKILKAKLLNSKSASINLTGKKAGTYNVKVETDGFPSGLKVVSVPDSITVTLQKK
ncbi:CdaR family protein [Terrilactibacillus laevilacticus]|nr:CdaR family protein [Terrilactibacillus laevilacticus]